MSARDELRQYVRLLADWWTLPTLTDERVERLYTSVRTEVFHEAVPVWEAVYEPGNVSDYLIGYTNDEAPAKAAAEAWFRSQRLDEPGRLEWAPGGVLATGRHDQWFDLIHHEPDLGVCSTGLIVRRRIEDGAA